MLLGLEVFKFYAKCNFNSSYLNAMVFCLKINNSLSITSALCVSSLEPPTNCARFSAQLFFIAFHKLLDYFSKKCCSRSQLCPNILLKWFIYFFYLSLTKWSLVSEFSIEIPFNLLKIRFNILKMIYNGIQLYRLTRVFFRNNWIFCLGFD